MFLDPLLRLMVGKISGSLLELDAEPWGASSSRSESSGVSGNIGCEEWPRSEAAERLRCSRDLKLSDIFRLRLEAISGNLFSFGVMFLQSKILKRMPIVICF